MTTTPQQKKEQEEILWHGVLGLGKGWEPPTCVSECDLVARPDQNEEIEAHEYVDTPATMKAKIALLAELIRKSNHTIAYTGAGISTSAGLKDYATKGDTSVAQGSSSSFRPTQWQDAQPTFSHFFLTQLYNSHFLHHWIQQNHDGLPQKAGFPQHDLNEYHGALYDPSNPVVTFWCPRLRSDLTQWLESEVEKGELVLALGTSLAGVYSDRVVVKAAERFWKGREEGGGWGKGPRVVESPSPKDKGGFLPTAPNYCASSSSSPAPSFSSSSTPKNQQHLGAVIINLQHTRLDPYTSLRIYGKLDEVFALLAEELSLPTIPTTFQHTLTDSLPSSPFVYEVPYDEEGLLSETKKTTWDLREGKAVKMVAGPGKGFVGRIFSVPSPSSLSSSSSCSSSSSSSSSLSPDGACPIFCVEIPCTQNECLKCSPKKYILGYWWVNEAVKGAVPRLPFVSVEGEGKEE